MKLLPDAAGRVRPGYAPPCCKSGIWAIHPVTGQWSCTECDIYGPERIKDDEFAYEMTEEEVAFAEEQSARRQHLNRQQGRQNQNNFDLDPLEVDRIGAICEYGASLILGLPWNHPVRDAPVKGPDVGPYYVKGTVLPEQYRGPPHLIIRDSDFDCPPGKYVLVVLASGVVALNGWCHIEEVKGLGVWCKFRADRPAWWVSSERLHPMRDLVP